MHILIIKDSSTKIPKEASAKEAESALAAGFQVELVKSDGSLVELPKGSTAAQIEAIEQAASSEQAASVESQPEEKAADVDEESAHAEEHPTGDPSAAE